MACFQWPNYHLFTQCREPISSEVINQRTSPPWMRGSGGRWRKWEVKHRDPRRYVYQLIFYLFRLRTSCAQRPRYIVFNAVSHSSRQIFPGPDQPPQAQDSSPFLSFSSPTRRALLQPEPWSPQSVWWERHQRRRRRWSNLLTTSSDLGHLGNVQDSIELVSSVGCKSLSRSLLASTLCLVSTAP